MKYFFNALVVAAISVSFSGCAMNDAHKKDEEANKWKETLPAPNANYGNYPINYEDLMKQYFSLNLKDPDSVRYGKFTVPRQEHIITNVNAKQAMYGYSSCVSINAKNSYGGYTGNQQYWFFLKNGEIIRSNNVSSGNSTIYIGRRVNCQDGNKE